MAINLGRAEGVVKRSVEWPWSRLQIYKGPVVAGVRASAALHACTVRCACLCTAQGQTSLRDRWSNTLHTSLPSGNMSSSPATAVFPFRGNCRFSVIYRAAPCRPPNGILWPVARKKKLERARVRSKVHRGGRFLCKEEHDAWRVARGKLLRRLPPDAKELREQCV